MEATFGILFVLVISLVVCPFASRAADWLLATRVWRWYERQIGSPDA